VLTDRLTLSPDELQQLSGWEIKAEGACKGDVCVPLLSGVEQSDGLVDVAAFAEQLGMPMASDEMHGLWAFGPRTGGRVLQSATFPELALQDFNGHTYDFAGSRGRKVVMIAWASW
jgi:hypothetical protein